MLLLPNLMYYKYYIIFLGGDDRCKLYCRVDKTSSYYLLKDKVIDGTPCDHRSTDKCVNGICRHVGCDGELESTATHGNLFSIVYVATFTSLYYCPSNSANNLINLIPLVYI